MGAQLKQVEAAFNPLVNAYVVTKTHNGLVNALAVLVADMMLLLTDVQPAYGNYFTNR
jgi:hypothetical protein